MGDGTGPSPSDSLITFLILNCPSFSILCSKTDHSRFGGDRLKEANTVPGLVREALLSLRLGIIGEEAI